MADLQSTEQEADTTDPADLTDTQIEQLLQRAEARFRDPDRSNTVAQAQRYLPKPRPVSMEASMKPYIDTKGAVATTDPQRLVDNETKQLVNSTKIRKIEDPVSRKSRQIEARRATAGPSWFNLPRTNLTPQLKRDLQLLRMRSVLDPKQHYKKDSTNNKPPEYSQVATVIEGPTDFFSARLSRRERKQTLVEEVLAAERDSGRFKKKYLEVQAKKMSGKKGDYRERMRKRYGNKNKLRR